MPRKKIKRNVHRYNLDIPEELYQEVQTIAAMKGTTFVELVRKFIRVGLIVVELEKQGGKLIIRTGDTEKEIIIV